MLVLPPHDDGRGGKDDRGREARSAACAALELAPVAHICQLRERAHPSYLPDDANAAADAAAAAAADPAAATADDDADDALQFWTVNVDAPSASLQEGLP
jgi:hypothetical protein